MLRRILMVLAVLVALVPYLGIPRAIDAYVFSALGMAMFLLLLFSKRSKKRQPDSVVIEANLKLGSGAFHAQHEAGFSSEPKSLEVAHDHVEIHPNIDVSPTRAHEPRVSVQVTEGDHTSKRRRIRKVKAEESVGVI